MSREEQERRRQLKFERKAIDRAVTKHELSIPQFHTSRWSYGRRMRANQRAYEGAYRSAAARISEIQRQLAEVPASHPAAIAP